MSDLLRQKQDLLSQSLECFMPLCSDKNLRAGEKRRKTSVRSQTLSSRFIWPVNAYFCPRYFTGIMDEKMVTRQHFSMVFDSLNNGTVYFTRNTFIVDKMK